MTTLPVVAVDKGGESNGNGGGVRWQNIVSIAALGITVTGALISLVVQASSTSVQVAALTAQVNNMQTQQALNVERLNETRAHEVALQASLVEIETQFCASDMLRNLMHANDLRYFSILWQNIFKHTLPTDNAYYPMVCNRQSQSPVLPGVH